MRRLKFYLLFLIIVSITACSPKTEEKLKRDSNENVEDEREVTGRRMSETLIARFDSLNLVDIQTVNSRISVNLKYSSEDNFMGRILYDTLDRIFLQRDIAIRLSKCQDYLDSLRPGFRLHVFDGLRPKGVQKEMWDALDSIPVSLRGRFVSNPAFGSVHNFGAAVDLTILDSLGIQLDMGAGYDDFRDIAFPKYEDKFLKSGDLSRQQWQNRVLLRKVMASQKFRNIPSEWWHFNGFSRITASHKYQLVLNESSEVQWFRIEPKIDSHSDSLLNPVISADSL